MVKYSLMLKDIEVMDFSFDGKVSIFNKKYLPYGLYIEDGKSVDAYTNNVLNIYHWLATRVIAIDRKYSKIIYNYLDLPQNQDEKTKALFSMSFHSLSLMDSYWIKENDEKIKFKDINLFDNSISNAFVDIFLRGKGITVKKDGIDSRDISTSGQCAKSWVREKDNELYLYKDGNQKEVKNEVLASNIISCFNINAVKYNLKMYDKKYVSRCKIITNKEYSIVNKSDYEIYCLNNGINIYDYILKLDGYSYYMMNILDYLIGNNDRHSNNWGFLVNNKTNKIVRLYDLMDFNKSFNDYKNMDGGKCMTTKETMTQKETAIIAVKKVGMKFDKKLDKIIDNIRSQQKKEMFIKRLKLLLNFV